MIHLFGITIYEFSIALSDLVLCIESLVCAALLFRKSSSGLPGATLFLFLSISSFFGAIFHAFFPLKAESYGGFIVWVCAMAAIGFVSVTIFYVIKDIVKSRFSTKWVHVLSALFLIAYFYTLLAIDYHYPTVIKFYAPPVLLLGAIGAWQYITLRKRVWRYLIAGVLLSIVAAAIQSLRLSFDEVYFNFNTLYHIVQGLALIAFYIFFRIHSEETSDTLL